MGAAVVSGRGTRLRGVLHVVRARRGPHDEPHAGQKGFFTVADLKRETAGVVCRHDPGVLDEIPSAYKSIDEVMAQQADLVRPVTVFKQFLCVKG